MVKKAIVCVDDEKIVLDSLKKELREVLQNEYTVEVAESGEEAIELFDELLFSGHSIPLVISDYIMPDMKGDAVLKYVKEKNSSSYTIMLTGQATIEGVTSAINNAGLYRYISKPWEHSDLSLTVIEALKSYDKDIELELRRKELEEANAKLIKLDSAKSYFLGLLSHELNTPLIGINGNAKLIAQLTDDEDIKESVSDILKSEARLRKFADISILITRIQTDKYETAFYQENIYDMIKQALYNLEKKRKQKNIKIDFNYPEEQYLKKIDASLISNVFEFVIDNSIKYSPEGELLTISSIIDKDKLKISIIDKGEGFSDKSLSNLFQYFESTDDLMFHSEGTGLSLAAAKVIMDMHNFEINARNSEEGGAVVEMVF
jgi:K+-sensing histidine kinase KdpD